MSGYYACCQSTLLPAGLRAEVAFGKSRSNLLLVGMPCTLRRKLRKLLCLPNFTHCLGTFWGLSTTPGRLATGDADDRVLCPCDIGGTALTRSDKNYTPALASHQGSPPASLSQSRTTVEAAERLSKTETTLGMQ